MKLIYQLTKDDYVRFRKVACARAAKRVPRPWRRMVRNFPLAMIAYVPFFAALIGLDYLLATGAIDERARDAAWYAIFAGAFAMGFAVVVLKRAFSTQVIAPDSPLLAEIQLTLDDDGAEAVNNVGRTRLHWTAIREVSPVGDLLVLWVHDAQGMIVPTRAFATPDERQQFVAFVQEHIAAAGK